MHSSQRGTKSHLKSQFPPELTLLKSQQNAQSYLKPDILLSQIYASKSFQADWSQVNIRQAFTDDHLWYTITDAN